MQGSNRPIFRADAVKRYIEGQQTAVFPRLVCRRTFLYLWILLGLLVLAGSFVTWFARGPLVVGEANTRPGVFSRLEHPLPLWLSPLRQPAQDC